MRKLFYVTFFTLLYVVTSAQVVIPPNVKAKTAFAIIADRQTFEETKDALLSYKAAVEYDGLATYVIYADWKSPDEVKAELVKLYHGAIPLEGAVLVGDIPIPMVRRGQHLTTAFKMSETAFPFHESSVPSDRFYDDLGLAFEFLYQDSIRPLYFYYNLTEKGTQTLQPSFYTARIKYPEEKGGNKYEAIAAFLSKAAAAKRKENKLDNIVSFAGSHYNSDCYSVWLGEASVMRENFPQSFSSNESGKFLNYKMDEFMKFKLLDELQRPEVDVFMFNEHGSPDSQSIGTNIKLNSVDNHHVAFRQNVYSTVRRMARREPLDSIKYLFAKKYSLDSTFFSLLDDNDLKKSDSVQAANGYIKLEDLKTLNTYPIFVVLNACYNGSFHQDGYIAGYYIFNNGNTLVTQGNTVNVLQDRWTYEMVGLLNDGLRVGHYNRMVATLEGHLVGDPTVRFSTAKPSSINEDVVVKAKSINYWKKHRNSYSPSIQALALRVIADNDVNKSFSPELLKTFKESAYYVVRMEALKLLSRYNNSDFTSAIALGLSDPYELIARMAAIYAGKVGDEQLLGPMVRAYITSGDRQRVSYNVQSSFCVFPVDKVHAAITKEVASSTLTGKEAQLEQLLAQVKSSNFEMYSTSGLTDTSAATAKRIESVTSIRNHNYHFNVELYFSILSDTNENPDVKVALAEALGWFKHSYRKKEVADFCRNLLSDGQLPIKLENELKKTLKRLE